MKNIYKLIIKDIQAIHYAEVLIDGISAIVGENNLGKSTINKILYALVKASKDMKSDQNDNLASNMIKTYFDNPNSESAIKVKEKLNGKNIVLNDIEMDIYENIIDLNDGIINVRKQTYFSNIFLNELSSPVVNRGREFGEIILYKNEKVIFDIDIKDSENGMQFNEKINYLKELDYDDVTYLEIADILPLYPVWGDILNSSTIKSSMKDIIVKTMKFNNENLEFNNDSLVYMGGRLLYKTKSKGATRFININNIGDGYKRLSLLNSLIDNKIVKKNTLFLLEEPEVGIHPKKMKEVVSIIKKLSKDMDIVFTTHDNLLINNFINEIKIFKATGDTASQGVLECNTIIKQCNKSEEILRPYIEPLTELRKSKLN
ncbi:MAG: AAA family ATPase [Sarcina sp.]